MIPARGPQTKSKEIPWLSHHGDERTCPQVLRADFRFYISDFRFHISYFNFQVSKDWANTNRRRMVALVEQMLGKPVQIATVKARAGQKNERRRMVAVVKQMLGKTVWIEHWKQRLAE